MDQDDEHLKLLAIGYWLMGGFQLLATVIVAIIFFVYGAVLYTVFARMPTTGHGGGPPPELIGGIVVIVGIVVCGILVVRAVLDMLVARALPQRKWRILALVMGGLHCLNVPLGTILGVFTFIVLLRPTVVQKFGS